jgi:hypothetical protein
MSGTALLAGRYPGHGASPPQRWLDSQMTMRGRGCGLSAPRDVFAVPGRPIYSPVTACQPKID